MKKEQGKETLGLDGFRGNVKMGENGHKGDKN